MKIRFLFVFLFLLFSIQSAIASSPWDPRLMAVHSNRFYVGGSFGQMNMIGALNRNLAVLTTDKAISLGESLPNPGAMIGYQTLLADTNIFVGLEIFSQFHIMNLQKTENTHPGFVEYVTDIRKKNSYGVTGNLGFAVNRTVFYVKGGAVMSDFRLSFTDKSGVPTQYSSKCYRKVGHLLGGGVEYAINNNWKIGLDYEYAVYPKTNLGFAIGSYEFEPRTYNTQVRLKYLF